MPCVRETQKTVGEGGLCKKSAWAEIKQAQRLVKLVTASEGVNASRIETGAAIGYLIQS